MLRLKQPSTLVDLAIEALGTYVYNLTQNAISAIDSGKIPEVNTDGLHRCLYSDLPSTLPQKITVHMLSVIKKINKKLFSDRKLVGIGGRQKKALIENVTLASINSDSTILDLSVLPTSALMIVIDNISRFGKLQTLIITDVWLADSIKISPKGFNVLKFLVYFKMERICTDAIIHTLGSCCSKTIQQLHVKDSENVTNASVKSLRKCHKLTHLSVSRTSMTAEGFLHLLKSVQQHKKSDDKAKGFLQISAGNCPKWVISSSQLNEIAKTSPMLKQLKIEYLRGDFETITNFTNLEKLKIFGSNINISNLDGFLRLRGSYLRSLTLMASDPNDLLADDPIDLMCVMNQCINLKKLKLFFCKIKAIGLGQMETAASPFQNLEILDISNVFPLASVEPILYTCLNIKVLRLYLSDNEFHLDDEFLLRLLSRNPMKKLTTFSAATTHFSMRSVKAILDQCPLLETLEYLSTWCLVTYRELKILGQNIKDTNQDLKINLGFNEEKVNLGEDEVLFGY